MSLTLQLIWKNHPTEPISVSTSGLIKSAHGKILATRLNRSGYQLVTYYDPHAKRHKVATVHRLVLETFIGPRAQHAQANHLNGNKTDNSLTNLEWTTATENRQHAIQNGLWRAAKGENHSQNILTNEQVVLIKEQLNRHNLTQRQIAAHFGVSRGTIQSIASDKNWRRISWPVTDTTHLVHWKDAERIANRARDTLITYVKQGLLTRYAIKRTVYYDLTELQQLRYPKIGGPRFKGQSSPTTLLDNDPSSKSAPW